MRVLVAGICAVLLSCRPALLLPRLAELSFHPPALSRPAGDTATFFCNISTVNFTLLEYSLNWYRIPANSNKSEKFAESNGNTQKIDGQKFQLSKHSSIVEMRILKLHKNDTGAYYCGMIAFSSPSKVIESNKSQLTVTDERNTTIIPGVTEELDEAGDFKVPLIIVLSVAGAVLLALFAYMLFIVMRRPAGLQKPQSENAPLEEKPPAVTVYTVDYGVLEFQQDENTKTPEESFPADQTEYATIVFSEERPVTPERGKKTKNQRACQTRTQP